jgi:hypothetical protein
MNDHPSFMISRERLEELYSLYHRRELVHPDPLEFLYEYRKSGPDTEKRIRSA